jgi:hypothetical protein
MEKRKWSGCDALSSEMQRISQENIDVDCTWPSRIDVGHANGTEGWGETAGWQGRMGLPDKRCLALTTSSYGVGMAEAPAVSFRLPPVNGVRRRQRGVLPLVDSPGAQPAIAPNSPLLTTRG